MAITYWAKSGQDVGNVHYSIFDHFLLSDFSDTDNFESQSHRSNEDGYQNENAELSDLYF